MRIVDHFDLQQALCKMFLNPALLLIYTIQKNNTM